MTIKAWIRKELIKKALIAPSAMPTAQDMRKASSRLSNPECDKGVDGNVLSGNRNGGKGYVDACRQQSHEESDRQNGHSGAAFYQIEHILKGEK